MLSNKVITEPLAKVVQVVRQAHHERQKGNDFNPTSVRPEPVEGHFLTFARGSTSREEYRARGNSTVHPDESPQGGVHALVRRVERLVRRPVDYLLFAKGFQISEVLVSSYRLLIGNELFPSDIEDRDISICSPCPV
jgi:hypothetical protein